ncbi:hypothetical protein TCDM_11660 [Trypanosoma cruzi Dm28c]|uniref:Mucin TcMUCII n=1 Tax=Trypanosoma cruzi Dm28c TaxID=1416333 RepID=V5AZU6_TRYCR|nr:hypothetical protein TCDM_11660 [Trypanosoma cruzi Dm28c]
MRRPLLHRKKVRTVRQGQKLTRNHPRKKEIRRVKILPREPPRQLQQRHQPPPPPLQLQKHQTPRSPAHRHVFVKSTAASAALRGCVPRCCLPHPRWRTPLWVEEVFAGCACQQSTAGICARPLWSDVNK